MKLYINKTDYFKSDNGHDLSIPLRGGKPNVNAWYCDPVVIEPVVTPNFIGDVNKGAPVNFRNIRLNPHGNGTHTECVGHISKENYTINQCLKDFSFHGKIISVTPKPFLNQTFNSTDSLVTADDIKNAIDNWTDEKVLIIRTLPNTPSKKEEQYSGTNPTYFTKEAITYINSLGVEHLMVDLPSIDREEDNGELIGHHTFWSYPKNTQPHKTISELLYIPDNVKDGEYIVQIQITSLENDASPSKIIAYPLMQD